jgi:transcriptional regulator with XRE-family HTH domain
MNNDQIRSLRDMMGMTQKEFAQILDKDVTQVSRWEKGLNVPRRSMISKIEKVREVFDAEGGNIRTPEGHIRYSLFGGPLRGLEAEEARTREKEDLAPEAVCDVFGAVGVEPAKFLSDLNKVGRQLRRLLKI